MTNMEMRKDGSKLIITVDLSKDFGPSKSGKTVIIATSSGAVPVPGLEQVRVNLNIYKGR